MENSLSSLGMALNNSINATNSTGIINHATKVSYFGVVWVIFGFAACMVLDGLFSEIGYCWKQITKRTSDAKENPFTTIV